MGLRIAILGTGRFALPAFQAILESRHTTVGLFTQPDRAGRGHHRHVNPLKERVAERQIPVFQPDKINVPEAIADLRGIAPDVCVVAAYGQILSAEVIGVPRLGAVNLHASLLPKYRGAAPIQTAILNGEQETGITIFQIEPKLDAGPVLAIEKTPIGPKETAGDLEMRLAALGDSMILPVLDRMETKTAVGLIQDPAQASRDRAQERERPHRLDEGARPDRLAGSGAAAVAHGVRHAGERKRGRASARAAAAHPFGGCPPSRFSRFFAEAPGHGAGGGSETAAGADRRRRPRDPAASAGGTTGHVWRRVFVRVSRCGR